MQGYYERPSLEANGTIYPFRFIALDTDYKAVQAGAGSRKVVGISHESGRAAPIPEVTTVYAAIAADEFTYYGPNEIAYIQVSGALAAGTKVGPDANGKAKASLPGELAYAILLESSAGADEYVRCWLFSGGEDASLTTGGIFVEEVSFTEAGDTTYTGSVSVPAGATILDVQVQAVALWDDGTSASMKVGDAADDDGFFTGVNLKATDLTAGQAISFAAQGGKGGVYITEGTGTHVLSTYSASARVVSGVVTTGAQNGTAGRTRMIVAYALPNTVTAATGA